MTIKVRMRPMPLRRRQQYHKSNMWSLYILSFILSTSLVLYLDTNSFIISTRFNPFPFGVAAIELEGTAVDGECKVSLNGSSTCANVSTAENEEGQDANEVSLEGGDVEKHNCVDLRDNCKEWKSEGECEKNPGFMLENCPKSCNSCPTAEDLQLIDTLAKYSVEQEVTGSKRLQTMDVIRRSVAYIENDIIGSNITPRKIAEKKCRNSHKLCSFWAATGQCEVDKGYMDKNCPLACQHCEHLGEELVKQPFDEDGIGEEETSHCVDLEDNCKKWKSEGECEKNPGFMLENCPKSCNSCPTAEDLQLIDTLAKYSVEQEVTGSKRLQTMDVIRRSVAYIENDIFGSNIIPRKIAEEKCRNFDKLCSFWATTGECETGMNFMTENCPLACQICDLIYEVKCPPLDPWIPPALYPGDINAMFERLVAITPANQTSDTATIASARIQGDAMTNYTVTVHSQPSPFKEGKRLIDKNRDLKEDPWVVIFDDFLTDNECRHIIDLGHEIGFNTSTTYGGANTNIRSSDTAWVNSGYQIDSILRQIYRRMETLIGMPFDYAEQLQILKYGKGQYYRVHDDYIPNQKENRGGPRILTFFLYLNDVEEGGETIFTKLNITITPKRGRAVLWPNVLDSDPKESDIRLSHEAKEVLKGEKFAANAWFHLFKFQEELLNGCA